VDRIENDKDNIVLITGSRGIGKSTFMIKVASGFEDMEKLENNCNDILSEDQKDFKLEGYTTFDMDRDIIYTIAGLQDLCMNHRKGVVCGDEAVVNMSRRNSMTKGNKQLHQIMTISRKNNNTVFLLLPSIEDVDQNILQYCSCWVHIDSRGLAVVFLPNKTSIFGKKRWDVDSAKKIHDKLLDENPRLVSVPYWIYSNFRGYVKFGKLSNAIEERYLRLAEEKKNIEVEKGQEEKVNKRALTDDQTKLIDKVMKGLKDIEISDSTAYYEYCVKLGFTKSRFNRVIGAALLAGGDARSPSMVIKDNKVKIKQGIHEQDRVIRLH
jgi:hypothetical protein